VRRLFDLCESNAGMLKFIQLHRNSETLNSAPEGISVSKWLPSPEQLDSPSNLPQLSAAYLAPYKSAAMRRKLATQRSKAIVPSSGFLADSEQTQ
jgi:hypothetical protein